MKAKARALGFNHIALEVGDIEAALRFYAQLFHFELRSRSETAAFIDLGDQFIALQKGRSQPPDGSRHFGLVVDDKEAVRQALAEAGIPELPGPFLDFFDPWGNRIEIVELRERAVHQGSERAARDGTAAPREERKRGEGAEREGDGAGLGRTSELHLALHCLGASGGRVRGRVDKRAPAACCSTFRLGSAAARIIRAVEDRRRNQGARRHTAAARPQVPRASPQGNQCHRRAHQALAEEPR